MKRMHRRVIALLLAVIFFWSGLSTFEAPSAFAQPLTDQPHPIAHAGGPAELNDGSVADHHLDDLPSQAQNDPPTDTPGLLAAPVTSAHQALVMATPRAVVSTAAVAPCLAGPLRPPCSDTHNG
jgi:hypothetical protein